MPSTFNSAEAAIRHSYYLLANPELGLRGTLVDSVGSGGGTVQEQIAGAAMVIRQVRETILDPYLAAIEGGMGVINWNQQIAWTVRREKFHGLLRLGTRIECPNAGYKQHALGAWSGMHGLDDDRWSTKVGVTTRTLRRWRLGDRGIWMVADQFLKIALSMAEDEFREVGIVE